MTASEMARALGRKGGRARAATLTAAERTSIAVLGAHARRRSLEAARRITDNLNYAGVLNELGGGRTVTRLTSSTRRLPGIYAAGASRA